VSASLGGLFVLRALDSKPLGALIGFLVGGALIYRGLTGHCPAFQALGFDTAQGNESDSTVGVRREKNRGISVTSTQ
jgi:uncharacterized membrane protein